MSDHARLNAFLATRDGGEHKSRGDLVILHHQVSETREIHRAERAAVLAVTLADATPFDERGLRLNMFRKNPVCLFDHDYEALPVARSLWERLREAATGGVELIAKVQFHLDTEVSREAWSLVEKGILHSWALGVLPDEWEWVERRCLPAACMVRKYDLCEIAVVPSEDTAERLWSELRQRRITAPAIVKALAARGICG